jgi:HEAT repeat protein
MSSSSDRPGGPLFEAAAAQTTKPTRVRSRIRTWVALLACGGGLLWASFVLWEDRHPAMAAARGLRSSQIATRLDAVRKVTEVGMTAAGEALPPLVGALTDPDEGVRTEAAKSISLVGAYGIRTGSSGDVMPATVSALFQALNDQSPVVRTEVIHALVNLSMTRPPGGGGGRGSKPAGGSAVPAKSLIEPERLDEALTGMLGDPSTSTRATAMHALAAMDSKTKGAPPKAVVSALDDPEPAARAAAIATVATFRQNLEPLVPHILKALVPAEPQQVRAAALRALELIDSSAISATSVPELLAALKNPDRDVRLGVLTLLARLDREARIAAIPGFIDALKEPTDTDVRRVTPPVTTYQGPVFVSAEALAKTAPGTPAANHAITALTALADQGPAHRSVAAAHALSAFGTEAASAVPALVKTLEQIAGDDVAPSDARTVTIALSRVSPGTPSADTAVQALIQALKSNSDAMREATLNALEQLGPNNAAAALPQLQALEKKEPSPKVRSAIESALKALTAHSR